MSATTAEDARRSRNSLREQLWADPAFAHRWIVHPDGAACPDGCDAPGKPSRVAFYRSPIEVQP